MDEKWLKDIANQLADYEAKAPEGLWERIDSSLKGGAIGPRMVPLTRCTSLRRVAYRVAAIALLTLLIGGGVMFYLNEKQLQPAHELTADVLDTLPAEEPQVLLAEEPEAHPAQVSEVLPLGVTERLADAASPSSLLPVRSEALPSSDECGEEEHRQQPLHKAQRDTEQQPVREAASRRSQRGYFVPATHPTPNRPHPFSISLLASNLFSDNRQTNGSGGVAMSSGNEYLAQEPISSQIQSGYGALDKHLIGNDGARIFDQEKHHKQPVRVGLSVSYPLSERLSIGLGLYYTYLSSDFKSGSEHNYQSAHQSLHYLGIPLSINYAFLRSSRFSFYVAGGMMAEKCISGQSELLTVSGSSREVEKQSLTEQRLQYSAFGSVGVQMDLVRHLGLYVEPGLSYYLDNHSRVVNLYKDEPLQFNLSAGVRFSF